MRISDKERLDWLQYNQEKIEKNIIGMGNIRKTIDAEITRERKEKRGKI